MEGCVALARSPRARVRSSLARVRRLTGGGVSGIAALSRGGSCGDVRSIMCAFYSVAARLPSPGMVSVPDLRLLMEDCTILHGGSWMPMKRRTLVSWSSGKDSAYLLHVLREMPDIEVG